MKKKNLVILSLILIMVLSLSLTAFAGCDPKEKIPAGYKAMSTPLNEVLTTALDNSTDGRYLLNDLKASGEFTFGTQYGDSSSKYKLSFAADVVLKETTSDNEVTEFGLSLVDAKANTNIINMYYKDQPKSNVGGYLYVDLGEGNDAKHLRINALSIRKVLNSENAFVSDETSENIGVEVFQKVNSPIKKFVGIIAGLGDTYQSLDNSKVLLRLSLDKVFKQAGDLLKELEVIDDYTTKMGLNVKSAELQSLLPKLSIDFTFSLDGAGADKFENAIYTGVDAKLNVDSKDFKVQRTDNSEFLRINIAKNTTVDLGIDFKFGDSADLDSMPYLRVDQSEYTTGISAIDFTTEGELELKEDLGVKLNLNGQEMVIAIPKGTYSIKLAVDLDPTKLIGMSFNVKGTDQILDLVGKLVTDVVKVLKVDIVKKDDPTNEATQLKLSIINGKANLDNLALLGDLGKKFPKLKDADISEVLDIVKGFIPAEAPKPSTPSGSTPSGSGETVSGSGESASGSGSTGSGNNQDPAWIAVAATVIKNLTVIVNNGTASAELKNQTVAQNHKLLYKQDPKNPSGEVPDIDEETGEQKYEDYGDTTLDISATANKSGLTLDAVLNNIVTDFDSYDANKITKITANIKVDSTGVTLTAKADNLSIKDLGKLPIDLVLKLTKFELGNAKTA